MTTALATFSSETIQQTTRKIRGTSREKAHLPIFQILDFISNVSSRRSDYGLKADNPLCYFEFGDIYSVPDSSNTRFGQQFKDGIRMTLRHGRGPNEIKPFFKFEYKHGEFYTSSRNEFFGEVKTSKYNGQIDLIYALTQWINHRAPDFNHLFEPDEIELDEYDETTSRKIRDDAVRAAVKKRVAEEMQGAENQTDYAFDTTNEEDTEQESSKSEYDVTDVAAIEKAAKEYRFRHQADIIIWGKEAEAQAERSTKKIRTNAILNEVRTVNHLQQAVDNVRDQLTNFSVEKFLKTSEQRLRGLFKDRTVPAELTLQKFLEDTIKAYDHLVEAIELDITACLERVCRVENVTDDLPDYSTSLRTHLSVFDREASREIKTLAREKNAGNMRITADRISLLKSWHAERREYLQASQQTWESFDLGITNYITCKYSQYDNLRILKDKINGDFRALLHAQLKQLPHTSNAMAPDEYNAAVQESREQIASAVLLGKTYVDELQHVMQIGAEYDALLVLNKSGDMKRLSRKNFYRVTSQSHEQHVPLALPHPDMFPQIP